MLTDNEIRKRLKQRLDIENANKLYRIVEELSICDGLARADIALINGTMHGYEIKSDHDSLERLPNQINCYDNTFDRNTIIVGKKYKSRALDIVPDYWGVIVAYRNRFGNITLNQLRGSRRNTFVSSSCLLDLLWSPEIKALLKEKQIKGYSHKNKQGLKGLVNENIKINTLKTYTRLTLRTRTGWREDLP